MIAALPIHAAWPLWIALMLVSIPFDSLYCGMETGVYVLNKIRMDLRVERGSRSARTAQKLLANPNNLLSVLLIGTNLSRYVATFSITSMFVLAGFGSQAEWLTLAVATPVLFVLGDAVPKSVFQRLAETLVYRFAWFIRMSDLLFRVTGLSLMVRGISAALMTITGAGNRRPVVHRGLSWCLAESSASGVMTHSQSVMADRIINISTVTVGKVMVPMRHVLAAPVAATGTEIMELIRGNNYSRIPLLDDAGRVAGILDVYDVLVPAAGGEAGKAGDVMSKPLRLSDNMQVTDALYWMQREHAVMAVVSDAAGRDVGIITIKDLVEEIVGELAAW